MYVGSYVHSPVLIIYAYNKIQTKFTTPFDEVLLLSYLWIAPVSKCISVAFNNFFLASLFP